MPFYVFQVIGNESGGFVFVVHFLDKNTNEIMGKKPFFVSENYTSEINCRTAVHEYISAIKLDLVISQQQNLNRYFELKGKK